MTAPKAADANVNANAQQHVMLFECRSCPDKKTADDSFTAPCEHSYCDECLQTMFR